ncbi:hypothetical protein BV394_14590 [Brevirhabdus pacifica]|uniref:Uncharacterized protein n=3 Tax=Brevirhabdus pacifica TaxID=1267768 RepID=A0A1U7DLM9_9RHOB|nr:thiamine pyrophosphate-dependent enzyme [Brevirhabdus pacifica]APX90789.1 hypothetical protein BV394_14590 [Brevirhabdus pacifica]OWU79572.1 hypothetical protein ATO5_00290 [Loktanella sp. 22II-4b]PJJ87330.1 acetolactate synthase-1/2/3 large subunit [Brevirhabdus pacifica]
MRAADHLVDCLGAQGADRLFCVPGESYLALLDALRDSDRIATVVCRHEGGAGLMAVADAKLTGRAGLVAVSRGPGATNVSIAVHLAQQDAVPLVVLIGQVARFERGRGAFQEVDYSQMFGGIAKGVWEVSDPAQLAETVARAFHVAASGTPGPVILSLPEDMLGDAVSAPVIAPQPTPVAGVSRQELARVGALLSRASRPLIIAGGGLAAPEGRQALAALAKAHGIPVALTFKHQEIFDNSSPLYAGHLGFKIPKPHVDLLADADLVLAIGTRLGDVPTQGYSFPRAPEPDQPLVHVWPDAEVPGRVFRTEVALVCAPADFCTALAAEARGDAPDRAPWQARIREFMQGVADYSPRAMEDGLDFGAVASALARAAPPQTIVVTDSGNFSGWVHRVWPWTGEELAVGSVGGAMGLGVPGAVAAAMRHPDRCVLGFVGDGGVLMTGNELATAMAQGARPRIVISDNGTYGTIRLHQERDHPGRVAGTDLVNPDFAQWARSFGAGGFVVGQGDDVDAVVRDFLAHDGAAVLHVRASAQAISAFATIDEINRRATASRA